MFSAVCPETGAASGLITPTAGTILWKGDDISGVPAEVPGSAGPRNRTRTSPTPKVRRSMSTTTWSRTPWRAATRRAASISPEWRWP